MRLVALSGSNGGAQSGGRLVHLDAPGSRLCPPVRCLMAYGAIIGAHPVGRSISGGQRSLRLETIVKIAERLEIDAGKLVSRLPVPDD